MTSSIFTIVLPSNTKNIALDYEATEEEQNKPYKFRVHFPKKLIFDKGHWLCGLKSWLF
jgi:hypothetical protein